MTADELIARALVVFPRVHESKWTYVDAGIVANTAVVADGVEVPADVMIGPYAVIGCDASLGVGACVRDAANVGFGAIVRARTVIGVEAVIGARARIENDVAIGPRAMIGPTAAVGARAVIGDETVVGLNAIVGNDTVIAPYETVAPGFRGADGLQIGVAAVKRDFLLAVSRARDELPFLRDALVAGEIDGSSYDGACCCLAGTIARARGIVDFNEFRAYSGFPVASDSLRESWFILLNPGDTPENSTVAKITLGWIDEAIAIAKEREVPTCHSMR